MPGSDRLRAGRASILMIDDDGAFCPYYHTAHASGGGSEGGGGGLRAGVEWEYAPDQDEGFYLIFFLPLFFFPKALNVFL